MSISNTGRKLPRSAARAGLLFSELGTYNLNMLTRRKRILLFWVSVLIFLAAVPVSVFYVLGYRLGDDFRLKKTGGLYISSPVTGSEISIDKKIRKRTSILQSGVFAQSLTPRAYKILVTKEGYRPWEKELRVLPQAVTEARALLVPAEPNAEVVFRGKFRGLSASPVEPIFFLIEKRGAGNVPVFYRPQTNEFLSFEASPALQTSVFKGNAEVLRWRQGGVVLLLDGKPRRLSFDFARRSFRAVPLGDETPRKTPDDVIAERTRTDAREFTKVTFGPERRELRAFWLPDRLLPYYFQASEELLLQADVRSFEFYPGRRDAVVAAFDNGIWAVELDSRGGRIIQPIYKGKEPILAAVPGGRELYALDDGVLMKIFLFPKEGAQ